MIICPNGAVYRKIVGASFEAGAEFLLTTISALLDF